MFCVYLITNEINGKVYVGYTNDFNRRMGQHKRETRWLINKAIKKYGWDNFTKEILIDNIGTEKRAGDFEKNIIKTLSSNDKNYGYNLTAGGDGGSPMLGRIHSNYTKNRMSVSAKNRPAMSEDTKEKIRNGNIVSQNKTDVKNKIVKKLYKSVRRISDGKIYDSMIECCDAENISGQKLLNHCKNRVIKKQYEYVNPTSKS